MIKIVKREVKRSKLGSSATRRLMPSAALQGGPKLEKRRKGFG